MGDGGVTFDASSMAKAMKRAKSGTIAKGARQKAVVFLGLGKKVKTAGGFTKNDLCKSKSGKIVTKKSRAAGLKAYKNIKAWTKAVQAAKKQLGLKGFVAIKKGSAVYKA